MTRKRITLRARAEKQRSYRVNVSHRDDEAGAGVALWKDGYRAAQAEERKKLKKLCVCPGCFQYHHPLDLSADSL